MSEFTVILIKELKSIIRDPKILIAMIIVPIVITSVMYLLITQSMKQSITEITRETGTIAVLDLDQSEWSFNLINYLKEKGYTIIETCCIEDIVESIRSNRIDYGLVILKDFSKNISENKQGLIEIYLSIRSSSMFSIYRDLRLFYSLNDYNRNLSKVIVEKYGLNSSYLFNPVLSYNNIIYKDIQIKLENPIILSTLISSTSFIYPVLVLILSSFLVQLSATSIGVEKEEKMFETLLSLPISRFKLIIVKITASILISLIGLIIYAGLFTWLLSSLINIPSVEQSVDTTVSIDLNEYTNLLSKIYGLHDILLIIVCTGVFIILILSLSIIIALFTEDVRSAQLTTQYLIIPVMFTMFIAIFTDISSIPIIVKYVLSIIPIANISLIQQFIFSKDYVLVYIVLLSTTIYALASIYIASKLVSTERVLTFKIFQKKIR
ncbi:MAG: ABC transporter permease [Desulfurococcaceae archaeon]